ncbi:unnamed protein product [Symbiodinium natans]|uniref:Uncharacterized protein n=1 Tax=Symbiodinium natans TaxID=878477 RepID=A0A812I843_9DINO|nr:unnamed protein product [Symbiodinium natans]
MTGFVLQGSILQLQIAPSALLPLFPRNVVELAFMLSQDLPRAPPAPPGTTWSVMERASMLVVVPPVGYVFPPQCEARDVLAPSTLSGSGLPPPYECRGVTTGAYSNATLLLIEAQESFRSGMLLKDQEYKVRLLVRNALFNAGELENGWRLLTRWAESMDSFVTLHQATIPGFALSAMQAAIQPTSVNPGTFHILNVTVSPRNETSLLTGSAPGDARLLALLLVAPRGTELTCAGFLPGSLGGGSGPGGWVDAERIACTTQALLPTEGPCADPGIPVSPGLWSMCLAAPRRPLWGTGVDVASASNGTRAVTGRPLWFGAFARNANYMPFDNTWLLVVLGDRSDQERPVFSGSKLLDVAGLEGYQLLKLS